MGKNSKIIYALFLTALLSGCIVQSHEKTPEEVQKDFEKEVIKLDVPLNTHSSDCVLAAVKMVLDYYYPEKDYSYEQIEGVIANEQGKWIWMPQAYTALEDFGVEAYLYSSADYQGIYGEGPKYIQKYYGSNAEVIVANTDFAALKKSIKRMRESQRFIRKELSFEDLVDHLRQGHLVIVMVDEQKIIGNMAGDQYAGHSIVLTGINHGNVTYHSPTSSIPNRQIPIEKFIRAWTSLGKPNDVVVATGRR